MKISPCKKCGSKNVELWTCGYSSFNPGGGKCRKCGFNVKDEVGCLPQRSDLIKIWNAGQRLTIEEKILAERKLLREELKSKGSKSDLNLVCSICKVSPRPCKNSPGSWQCDCIYDPVSGKGHWDKPRLIVPRPKVSSQVVKHG